MTHHMFVVTSLLSTAFIHATTAVPPLRPSILLGLFVLGRVMAKSALHCVTMHYLGGRKLPAHPENVYFVLIPPVVLVETQMRVAFLRFQSDLDAGECVTPAYLFGSLAVVEVQIRGFQLFRVHRNCMIRAELQRLRTQSQVQAHSDQSGEPRFNVVHVTSRQRQVLRRPVLDKSKDKALFFLGASTLADMYAEYVAIVCSACVLGFYRGHPKYPLFQHASTQPTAQSPSKVASNIVQTIAIQGLTEVVVDMCCSAVEIAYGVPLHPSKRAQWIVFVSMLGCGMINIYLCAVGYIGSLHQS